MADSHVDVGRALAGISEHASAAEAYRQAVAIIQGLPPERVRLYDLVCAQSLLAGSLARLGSGRAGEAEAVGFAAVATLGRAIAAGFRNLPRMKADSDLDPIRNRPDFQALMADLTFPMDVFAP